MIPIKFPEQNIVFAENQEPYLPLPAYQDGEQGGRLYHCWQMTWKERFKLLLTGQLWINVLNFQRPPQPILPMAECPFRRNK